MPIINTSSDNSGFELAEFEANFEFEAVEEITKIGFADFAAGFQFLALDEAEILELAEFESEFVFEAFDFLNDEPNILEEATFESAFEFIANGTLQTENLALFQSGFEFIAIEEFRTPETFEFNLTLDILPENIVPGRYVHTQPRLKIDGVEIPIISGTVSDDVNAGGRTLDVQLARIADKDLIGIDADIEFGFGTKTDGVWNESTFITLLSGAMRRSLNHSLAWDNNQPQDTVSFQSVSGDTTRMMKTAERDLVIYDSSRLTLRQQDFEILFDSQGRQFTTELKPIGGLRLNALLQEIVVQRCGFAGYRTNLPNFRIKRVDIEMGSSLIDSIIGYFGMFDPVMFEEDGILWIIDTTVALPAGFPAPKTVAVSQYRTLSKQDERRLVDALMITYVEDKLDYDYITTRTETDEELQGDLEVRIETLIREYRKFAQPFVVQREEAYQVNKTFRGVGGVTVKTSQLTIEYDSRNRINSRTLRTQELLPDLLDEMNPGALALLDSERIDESFTWAAHPFDTRREYLASRVVEVRSLVAIDAANPQLDSPYERKLAEVYLSGNVTVDQVLAFKRTSTTIDTAEPKKDGTVKIRRVELNHLLNLTAIDEDADPVGDVSVSGLAASPNRMLVFYRDNAPRTTDRIENFNAGELPATIFVPLARRRLKMIREYLGGVVCQVIGFDPSLHRGIVVRATGRGETLGDVIITGLSISARFGSVVTNLTTRRIS